MYIPQVLRVEKDVQKHQLHHNYSNGLQVNKCSHGTFPVGRAKTLELLHTPVSHLNTSLQCQLRLVNRLHKRLHVGPWWRIDLGLSNVPRVTKQALTGL